MVLSTAQVRSAWAPKATPKHGVFIPAYSALDSVLRRWGFNAGKGDTAAYNDRPITGGTLPSLHAYGPGDKFTFWFGVTVTTAVAVDIDWQNNPYSKRLHTNMPRAMIDEIEAIRTKNGKQVWRWGGDYENVKDAMHFEIVCTPDDLATGVVASGMSIMPSPGAPAPKRTPQRRKKPHMPLYIINLVPGGSWAGERWLLWDDKSKELVPPSHYSACDTGYGLPVPYTSQEDWDRIKEIYPNEVKVDPPA